MTDSMGDINHLPEGLRSSAIKTLAGVPPEQRTLETLLQMRRQEFEEAFDGPEQYGEVLYEEISAIKAAIAKRHLTSF